MISCIITTYNRAEYIERAIKSVMSQSNVDFEILIIDDGSIDNTLDRVMALEDERIRYIYQENKGAQVARNKGILLARGEYIAFLDSDDVWTSNKLEIQMKKLKKYKADILISKFSRSCRGKHYCIPKWSFEGFVTESMLSSSFFVTTGTIFGKKECIEDIMFDVNVSRFQDFDFIASAVKKYRIFFCNDVLLEQYDSENSITNNVNVDATIDTLDYLCNKHRYIPNLKMFLCKIKLKILLNNEMDCRKTWIEYCELNNSWYVLFAKLLAKIISVRILYNAFQMFNTIKFTIGEMLERK